MHFRDLYNLFFMLLNMYQCKALSLVNLKLL